MAWVAWRLPLPLEVVVVLTLGLSGGDSRSSLRVPRTSDSESSATSWRHPPDKQDCPVTHCPPPTAAGVIFADQCGRGLHATDARGNPDHTCVLQAALNQSAAAGVHTVLIRNLSSATPWVTQMLTLFRNDLEIVLEYNAFLQAKRDYIPGDSHGSSGCHSGHLFLLENCTNITVRGLLGGPDGTTKPTWRGWKWDHMNNTWSCGQGYNGGRMGFWLSSGPCVDNLAACQVGNVFNNTPNYPNDFKQPANWQQYAAYGFCNNIRILNLNIEESGGDGIYIEGCSNIHIANVSATGHIRQVSSGVRCCLPLCSARVVWSKAVSFLACLSV